MTRRFVHRIFPEAFVNKNYILDASSQRLTEQRPMRYISTRLLLLSHQLFIWRVLVLYCAISYRDPLIVQPIELKLSRQQSKTNKDALQISVAVRSGRSVTFDPVASFDNPRRPVLERAVPRCVFKLKTFVPGSIPERQTSLARFLETCYARARAPSSVHFRRSRGSKITCRIAIAGGRPPAWWRCYGRYYKRPER